MNYLNWRELDKELPEIRMPDGYTLNNMVNEESLDLQHKINRMTGAFDSKPYPAYIYRNMQCGHSYKKELDTINNFQLSYCSTVHKLQGSEFKFIVLVLPQDSIFIDSRLLYTAITRSKSTVIMLTNKAITSKVVARNNLLKRNTGLKERLINTIREKDNV